MHGVWWWADRWRKSTAYGDMTAEEQGLYRNLLDELWLRPNHAIPDDQRILAKASGDHEAWQRSGTKVLRWMTLTAEGWTNETALAVIGDSERIRALRSEAGKAGAKSRWNGKRDGKRMANAITNVVTKTCPPDQDQFSGSVQISSPSETHPPDGGDSTPVSTSNGNGYKPVSAADLAEAYNEYVAARVSLPAVTLPLSVDRKRKAAMRAKEHPDPKFWSKTFGKLIASKFARGEGDWRGATFDWLIANPTNVCKLAEGNYDDTERERRR